VRNIVRELPSLGGDQELLPVALLEGKLRCVEHLLPDDDASRRPLARWYARAEREYQSLWRFHASFDSANLNLRARILKKMTLSVCHLLYPLLMVCKRLRNAAGLDPVAHRSRPLELRGDDTLVLLDSSWLDSGFTSQIEAARVRGLRIVAVVYDLIPIRHPEFCDEFLIGSFGAWFQWSLANADAFVCISKTVRMEVEDEATKLLGLSKARRKGYEYFHLGSELDLKDGKRSIPEPLGNVFAGPAPVCLMVSTIEPRKNHNYLLDAFERVWEQNGLAKLCIIGKPGWKCDELLARIRNHRERGRRLFLLESVDDDGLEYAYANAAVLVFPSMAEGFGLPLVEAMQRGLPVIASDIPVFRETGGDFVAYCDVREPKSLARMVLELERTGKVPAARDPKDWRWITWRESAQQLVKAVEQALKDVKSKVEHEAAA
jgi:alpha-1,2-rhamnosyltransferase